MMRRCPRFLTLLGGLALAGCQAASPALPESPLVGTWWFRYNASIPTNCGPESIPVGYGGGGELEFETARDGSLSVSGSGSFWFQTCSTSLDGAGPIDATRLAAPVQLSIHRCEATIPEPRPRDTSVDGTVICGRGAGTSGTITLERR